MGRYFGQIKGGRRRKKNMKEGVSQENEKCVQFLAP